MWATNALLASLHPVLPVSLTLPKLGLDWRVLVGTLGFCLMASLIFGAWPAWALTGRAVVTDLKRHAGEDGRQPGGIRIGNALVIGQVALSLLLLATGGLFLMSALAASTADPGFRLDRGVLVEIDPSLAGYDEARGRQSHIALVDRLRTVPGVEAVSIGSSFPFNSITGDSRDVAPAGVADARAKSVDAVFTVVGRDYARVLGLPMLAGRDFSDAELASGSDRVAIIDDALAQGLWPGASALGQLIQFLDDDGPAAKQPIRVIGIVPAVKHSLGEPRPFPHVYVPLGQRYESAMTLHLRVASDQNEHAMLGTIARVIRDADDRLPVLRVETWRDHVYDGLDVWIFRAAGRVFSAFGAIALLLAVIGVYGVKSYVVSRRTREFGIRIATGAYPRALLWQVLREGSRTTIVGIAIGLVLALGAGQFLRGILYGVDSVEPLVLMTAPLVLLAASLLASLVPALRATRVDPTVALRAE
jgi:predicted permease